MLALPTDLRISLLAWVGSLARLAKRAEAWETTDMTPTEAAVLGCAAAALVAQGLGTDHGDFDLEAADAVAAATATRPAPSPA